jgi:cytochrome P450 family 12
LYGLAKNPDKQETLRREVLKILPEKSSKFTTQSLNSIPYLRAVIKEGLRVYPPVNGNLRAAGQNLVIKGYQVPADVRSPDTVYCNLFHYWFQNFTPKN